MLKKIAIFGEAEKGMFQQPYLCESLSKLFDNLGNPVEKSSSIAFAIQSLLSHYGIVYFRVHEEGFSKKDYMKGLQYLEESNEHMPLSLITIFGVGDKEIITAARKACKSHNCYMLIQEKDLYDYYTH